MRTAQVSTHWQQPPAPTLTPTNTRLHAPYAEQPLQQRGRDVVTAAADRHHNLRPRARLRRLLPLHRLRRGHYVGLLLRWRLAASLGRRCGLLQR